MSNGHLKVNANGEWQGKIQTLHVDMDIKLERIPSTERKSDSSPVFNVMARGRNNSAVKVGVAFEKRIKDTQEAFYSLTIDDPSMAAPLYVTAFPAEEQGKFDIVWQRPRKKEAA